MDLSRPHRSLGMGVTGDVLVALASLRSPLSGRRIAARAGVSASQAAKVLSTLDHAGLVATTYASPAILYELDREHVLAQVVDALVHARRQWRIRLDAAVRTWAIAPVAVAVFGSAATGTATADSDIDVLVIRPDKITPDDAAWSTQVADLALALSRSTGNGVDIVDVTARELAANKRLLSEVRAHGDVVVGQLVAVKAESR